MKSTTRNFLLFLFILLGVIPLVIVLGIGILRHTNYYLTSMTSDLERILEMPVKLAAVRHIRPGLVQLRDVVVTDPQTRQPLFKTDSINVTRTIRKKPDGSTVTVVCLAMQDAILDASCAGPLWNLHHRVLSYRELWGNAEIELTVSGSVRVTVPHMPESLHYKQVSPNNPQLGLMLIRTAQLHLHDNLEGTQTDITFLPVTEPMNAKEAPSSSSQLVRESEKNIRKSEQTTHPTAVSDSIKTVTSTPVRIIFQKSRTDTRRFLTGTLETGSTSAPTQILGAFFPSLLNLGEKSLFSGRVAFKLEGFTHISGEVSGRFINVSLQDCFSPLSPRGIGRTINVKNQPHLTGIGEVQLNYATFNTTELTGFSGTYTGGPGFIRREMLDRLVTKFGLSTGGIPLDMTDNIRYEQMSFRFTLENGQFLLAGTCAADKFGPGIFLVNSNGPILREPHKKSSPVSAAVFYETFSKP